MKFNYYFQGWIKKSEQDGLRITTINIYKGYLRNYISKDIGELEIKNISIKILQDFYDNIIENQSISSKTLRNIHSVIHRCFRQAVIEGVIEINPADYIDLPKNKQKEVQILNNIDIFKLENIMKNETLSISIYLALKTGLRLGEILGLKWCDISFEKKELEVKRSVSRQPVRDSGNKKTKLVLQKPKTENSQRKIPIQNDLVERLFIHLNKQKQKYNLDNIDEDFVLSRKYLEPIDPRTIQEFFKRMQIKCGINSNYKFHALRHTFASNAIEKGVSDKVTSKILGHSSVSTTLNIYTHISDGMMRSLMDKI